MKIIIGVSCLIRYLVTSVQLGSIYECECQQPHTQEIQVSSCWLLKILPIIAQTLHSTKSNRNCNMYRQWIPSGMRDQRTLRTCHSLLADRWCVDRRLLVLCGTGTVLYRSALGFQTSADRSFLSSSASPVLVERQAAPPPNRLQIARSLNYPLSLSV